MKKALSTTILATILIASSALADTGSNQSSGIKTPREIRQEHREARKENRNEIRDFRKESRDEIKQAQTECRARLEAATTDTEKETIKAECKAEAKAQREALRDNIKQLRQENFASMLADLKSRLE